MQPGSKQTQRQKANATSGTMEQPSPDGSHDYMRQVAGIGGEEMKQQGKLDKRPHREVNE